MFQSRNTSTRYGHVPDHTSQPTPARMTSGPPTNTPARSAPSRRHGRAVVPGQPPGHRQPRRDGHHRDVRLHPERQPPHRPFHDAGAEHIPVGHRLAVTAADPAEADEGGPENGEGHPHVPLEVVELADVRVERGQPGGRPRHPGGRRPGPPGEPERHGRDPGHEQEVDRPHRFGGGAEEPAGAGHEPDEPGQVGVEHVAVVDAAGQHVVRGHVVQVGVAPERHPQERRQPGDKQGDGDGPPEGRPPPRGDAVGERAAGGDGRGGRRGDGGHVGSGGNGGARGRSSVGQAFPPDSSRPHVSGWKA